MLRRTLLHVGTFVFGSVAFVALASFILVTIAKGIIPSSSSSDRTAEAKADDSPGTSSPSAGKTRAGKRGRKVPRSLEPPASKDD